MQRKIKNESVRRRLRRAKGIRKRISGTADRPRLAIYRSAIHIYAQLVDDDSGSTIAASSTVAKTLKGTLDGLKKTEAAEKVGLQLAEQAKAKGIEEIVFDRKGWPFHGRVAALAKGAREGGLRF